MTRDGTEDLMDIVSGRKKIECMFKLLFSLLLSMPSLYIPPIFAKYLFSVGSEVLHKLDSFIGCIITAWLGFGTVHVCTTRLGAARWVTVLSVIALV